MKYQQLSEEEEIRDIFFGIINRFIGLHTRESVQRSANDTANEYPFVPMDTRQLFDQLYFTARYLKQNRPGKKNFSFIDVGCGIGNVMLFAEQMDFDVFGFEKDPYPCEIAKKIMGEDRVREDDIWKFEGYENFDVIYYFRPFPNADMQTRFERMIEDKLTPGGILIANRKMSKKIDSDPRFTKLRQNLPVWLKSEA
ncbi:MAG: class I SAM-dependent methyltransferase [Desulfobulbaceae bacterium]|nr:class I SAM-dependent methyltransferase [Desulfobulbaceae bacterium]